VNQTELEHRVRRLMEDAAGEPPRPLPVSRIRRRVVRRRLAVAVSALIVALGGASVSAALAGRVPHPDRPLAPPVPTVLPAGVPRYYVEQGTSPGGTAYVRSTASGTVHATVRCPAPAGGRGTVSISSIRPAAGGRFFVACQQQVGLRVSASLLYQFRLTSTGQASGLSPVPGGVFSGDILNRVAADASGSELAVVVQPGSPRVPDSVVVLSTSTGQRAVWRELPPPGLTRFWPFALSLTGNGRELVLLGEVKCEHGPAGTGCRGGGEQVRAVSPARSGGSLSRSRLLLRQSALGSLAGTYINDAVISPDGSTLAVALLHMNQGGGMSVLQVSAATGREVRMLYRMKAGNDFSYGFFSTDPSGPFLLLEAGPQGAEQNGWIDRGQLIPLRAVGGKAAYEAWSGQ
jgi:hypothetical protein